MKSFSRFLGSVILVVVLVTSCKKDDGPPPKSNLVGTFTMVSTITTDCSESSDNVPLTNCTNCPVLVFTETTLTTTYPGGSQPVVAQYEVDGNALLCSNKGAIPGTTSFSDNITLFLSGTSLTLTILATVDNGNCKTVVSLVKS